MRQSLGITDSLVRLSVGVEKVDDLIEDLKTAFAAIEAARQPVIPSEVEGPHRRYLITPTTPDSLRHADVRGSCKRTCVINHATGRCLDCGRGTGLRSR